jgi:hypothetical protein
MPLTFNFVSSLRRAACLVVVSSFMTASVPTWINVITVIHDEDTAVPPNQYLMRSDHYNGSFQATYTNTANKAGTGGVRSQIDAGGGSFILYLGNQSLRTIWLSLASQGAPVPDGYYYANVELYSQCFDVNNQATGWLAIPPGSSNNRCTLGVDFTSGKTKYKLAMGPTSNLSGTGWATVSCNDGPNATTCNSWTVTPNTNPVNGNVPTVANLYQFTNNGSLAYIGQYHNTYRIDVTNP